MYEYILLYNHLDIYCNARIGASETLCLKIYSSKKKNPKYCVYDAFFIKGGAITLLTATGQPDFFDGVITSSPAIHATPGPLVSIKVSYQGIQE